MNSAHETLRQLMAEPQDKILLVELNNDVRFRSQSARARERLQDGRRGYTPSRNPVRCLMSVPAPYWLSPLTLYGTAPTHKRWVHLNAIEPHEVRECQLTNFDVSEEPILSREKRILLLLPIALTLEAGLIDGNEKIVSGKKLIERFSTERTKQ